MMRVGCQLPTKEIPIFCKVLRRPPLLLSLPSQGSGACIRLALPLTVEPASSTLIYGAIWCQVIAHQYPIHHPLVTGCGCCCTKLRLLRKSQRLRTQEEDTGNATRPRSFLLVCSLLPGFSMNEGGGTVSRARGCSRASGARKAPSCPNPYSPIPMLSRCSSVLGIKQKSAYSIGHYVFLKKMYKLIDWKEIYQNTNPLWLIENFSSLLCFHIV